MIFIFGHGGFAREVKAAMMEAWECEIGGFIVDEQYYKPTPNCYPASFLAPDDSVILAVGSPEDRKTIFISLPERTNYLTINTGKVLDEDTVIIGNGSIIQPGAILTTDIILGRFVQVNLNATIGHDCRIGDFTTISPGANLSGNVMIGRECYIGSNAVIREKITICDQAIIGAGAVVVKDIIEPGTYVGNPLRKIK